MRPSCLLLVAEEKTFNRKGRKETRKVRKEKLGNPSQTRGWIE